MSDRKMSEETERCVSVARPVDKMITGVISKDIFTKKRMSGLKTSAELRPAETEGRFVRLP